MPNALVLNQRANLIIAGYQHLTNEALTIIKEKYAQLGRSKNVNYKLLLVCDVIFHKWLKLETKYKGPMGQRGTGFPVTIKQLMGASEAFRKTITSITPQKDQRGATEGQRTPIVSKSSIGNPTLC